MEINKYLLWPIEQVDELGPIALDPETTMLESCKLSLKIRGLRALQVVISAVVIPFALIHLVYRIIEGDKEKLEYAKYSAREVASKHGTSVFLGLPRIFMPRASLPICPLSLREKAFDPNASFVLRHVASLGVRGCILIEIVMIAVSLPFEMLNCFYQGWVSNDRKAFNKVEGLSGLLIKNIFLSLTPLEPPVPQRDILYNDFSYHVDRLKKTMSQITPTENSDQSAFTPAAETAIAILRDCVFPPQAPLDQKDDATPAAANDELP
jgi:uncharacterized membrane protein